MSIPVVALFNNKAGVGRTSLAYHLAWMYADSGVRVLAADLDPQAGLSAFFIDDEQMEIMWEEAIDGADTIYKALQPLIDGAGDVAIPAVRPVSESLWLLVGDLSLSAFEDDLSAEWPACLAGESRAFRAVSAFWRILQGAAERCEAQLVILDLGPNLGAVNRAALIAADHVLVPLAADPFAIRGIESLGPRLRSWREGWKERLAKADPAWGLPLPEGRMTPMGYVAMQSRMRLDRPFKAYTRWVGRIPTVYREMIGDDSTLDVPSSVEDDPHCLGVVKHYSSLVPMAQEARKPMFHLRAADGALGAHLQQVENARMDFQSLARAVLARVELESLWPLPL